MFPKDQSEPWPELFLYLQCVNNLLDRNEDEFGFTKGFLPFFINTVFEMRLHRYRHSLPAFIGTMAKSPQFTQPLSSEKSDEPLAFHTSSPLPWLDYILANSFTVLLARERSNQQILSLPNNVNKLKANNGVVIPDSLSAIASRLGSLSLIDGWIWALPSCVETLVNLTHLYLTKNRLSVIPAAVLKLTGLSLLDISSNRIEIIPRGISELVNLKVFTAHRNFLFDVTPLCAVRSLEKLELNKNIIADLPDELRQLTALTSLDMAQNKLSHVSSTLLGSLARCALY